MRSYKNRVNSFSSKLFFPMMLLSVFQILTLVGALYVSGEFNSIRQYAYNMLIEKNENRKNYIESTFLEIMPEVYDANSEINDIIEKLLDEQGKSIEELSKDSELSKDILNSTIERLIYLLRVSSANDVFIVLDTGELYNSGDSENRAAIYIRDMEAYSSRTSGNEDLLMEAGNSKVANANGITLDFEWSAQIDVGHGETSDFDFYHKTINGAKKHTDKDISDLGYWSGFSKISNSALPSVKYTVPLISSNGIVYGVVGIGFLEKNILKYMPAKDSFSHNTCYVLGADLNNDDKFAVVLHYGSLFTRLVDNPKSISLNGTDESVVYDLSKVTNSVSNIQFMNLYGANSPYNNERWAIISIADKSSILNIYKRLIRMLWISSAISIFLIFIMAIIINRIMTTPVKSIVKELEKENYANEIIRFKSSGISEVDTLTNAIEELQINVKEQSSRVSKIISMVNVGIGVFMCDLSAKNVYVGESLIKLLKIKELPPKDISISFERFKNLISEFDTENNVCSNEVFSQSCSDINVKIQIQYSDIRKNDTLWYEFTMNRSGSNVIGLVQDVTKQILEKKKIEYERDYDITTGLLNRRAYYSAVNDMFCNGSDLKISAFIMIDLDNLKYVNDTYGHDFGDDYIKTAANALKGFREYGGIVARMSGDEFNVFLSGFDNKQQIRNVIDKIRKNLVNSYCILTDGTHYKIRASAGISWYPDDSTSYEMLIKYADFAMYTVKHSTKGNIAEFDINLYSKDSILITGVEEMNSIIDEQRLRYAFQPIISVSDGSIYGYEALMRPQSDTLRSPLEFIRLARTGAKLSEIERLTWILSIKEFRIQCDKGNIADNSKLFINSLSNCTMKQEDISFIEDENDGFLDRIVMEILESERANIEYTNAKKKRIQNWNALMALDDFGSGYNNEYSLITLNPDMVKIDRSIISNCDNDINKKNIISNLVKLSKTKNVFVIAEGIETYGEMKTVIECGVDLLQGYYFSRPVFEPEPLDAKITEEILNINNRKH